MECDYGKKVYGNTFCHKSASSYYMNFDGQIICLCIEHKYDPLQEDILMFKNYVKLDNNEIICMEIMDS
jgi:hypothetical protein